MKTTLIISGTLCLLLVGCANPGEVRRRDLRDNTTTLNARSAGRIGEIAANARILRGDAPESDSPTLRWQAAQNLGTLQAITHIDLLLLRGISTTADASANVRRECVLALGHMPIKTALSERRRMVVQKLFERLTDSHETSGRLTLAERDGETRVALISTIITLGLPAFDRDEPMPSIGFQDVANVLYLTALHHSKDSAPGDERINDLIVERALGGLEFLVGVDAETWRAARRDLERRDYIEWWNQHIAAMPRLDQYKRSREANPSGA